MPMLKILIILICITVSWPAFAQTDCDMDTPCSEEPVDTLTVVVPEISYADFLRLYKSKEKFVLLDIRPQEMFILEHIKGARNLFVVRAANEQIAEVLPDKNTKIVVYCSSKSCPMSFQAAKHLLRLGYTHVFNYAGGIAEWRQNDQATERAPQPAVNPNP